jgi:hypothetical protein
MTREPLIPAWFVQHFLAHRHFWAAHEIDIVARKDGQEYRLEAQRCLPQRASHDRSSMKIMLDNVIAMCYTYGVVCVDDQAV